MSRTISKLNAPHKGSVARTIRERKLFFMGLCLTIFSSSLTPSQTYGAENLDPQRAQKLGSLNKEYALVQSQKKSLEDQIHNNQYFTKTEALTNLEKKLINISDAIVDLHTSWDPGNDYLFFVEDTPEKKIEPTFEDLVSKFKNNHERVCIELDYRIEVNINIIKKINVLLSTLDTEEAKDSVSLLKRIIIKMQKHTTKKTEDIIDFLDNTPLTLKNVIQFNDPLPKNPSKTQTKKWNDKKKFRLRDNNAILEDNRKIIKDINNKIDECQFICSKDQFSMIPIIMSCIKKYKKPTSFLSEPFIHDLEKTLTLLSSILKKEAICFNNDESYSELNTIICEHFLSLHDFVYTNGPINGVQLTMLMGAMHFARKHLNSYHIDALDVDEDLSNQLVVLGNTVESFGGKYISWHLNRRYFNYIDFLFNKPRINQNVLNFYDFAQEIKSSLDGVCDWALISCKLSQSGYFEYPIVISSEFIWVHKNFPYVVRVKNNKDLYTIGLIKEKYKIETPQFFRKNFNQSFGYHYKLNMNTAPYPTICDQYNELLKLTYRGSYGMLVPANWKHDEMGHWDQHCGWEENVRHDNNLRNSLMAKAHLNFSPV